MIDNRPGLSEIAYRIGTWAEFKASMLDVLAATPALAALRTRSEDDFTIALCDAFAVVCDILTFSFERSANEHYLRTAAQQLSVTELAALIGYQPLPGVAASAALSFILDAPPPALPQAAQTPQPALVPASIALPAGTKVQSVPGPGEQPVTFETTVPVTARYAWNALAVQTSQRYANDEQNGFPTHLRLQGLIGTLQAGDYVLIVATVPDDTLTGLNRVAAVQQDRDSQTTLVTFETVASTTAHPVLAGDPTKTGATLSGTPDAATIGGQVLGVTWPDQTAFVAQARKLGWDVDRTQAIIDATRAQGPAAAPFQVFKLGIRASAFGHNAPNYYTLPSYTPVDPTNHPFPGDWEGTTLGDLNPDGSGIGIYLDTVYPALVGGSWIVLMQGGSAQPMQVGSTETTSKAQFLLSSSVTLVHATYDDASILADFTMRGATVLGASEEYVPAEELLDGTTVGGATLTLASAQLWLQPGQEAIVTGTSAERTAQTVSELRTIQGVALVAGRTRVTFERALDERYLWNSVTINANVAPATHGESRTQILGSGDATQAYQRFALNQLPVTYVSAATPATIASTLVVRVNGVAWTEVPFLFGHGPTERVYVTRLDTAGNRYVEFGDGAVNGARLPTGQNNVIATYRQGLGSAGNVKAGQLSTLLTRPLGLHGAVNPLLASGGGDPQTLADARATAPITVRALDRIVSLDDYGDFARASAAVAKAEAVWAWDGTRRVVCITVAGPAGAALVPGTPAYDNLLAAIRGASDGTVPVRLCSYVPRSFTLGATLTIDPAYDADTVVAAARDALHAAFAFAARDFMQPVYRSEIVALVQRLPGVVALTLDTLAYADLAAAPLPAQTDGLVAAPPRLVAGVLLGAELLTIDPGPLPAVVSAS